MSGFNGEEVAGGGGGERDRGGGAAADGGAPRPVHCKERIGRRFVLFEVLKKIKFGFQVGAWKCIYICMILPGKSREVSIYINVISCICEHFYLFNSIYWVSLFLGLVWVGVGVRVFGSPNFLLSYTWSPPHTFPIQIF